MKKLTLFALLILSLAACADDSVPNAATSAGPIIDRAQAEQDRRDADRRIVLANAQIAQRTADAQAFELSQRKAAAAATAEAVKLQATVAADNARAAMQARNMQATSSAIEARATVEARAAAATATADAQQIAASLARIEATATAQAVTLAQDRARADEARVQSDSEFYNALWRVVIVLALLIAFIFGVYAVNGILNVSLLRRAVIETRGGTMIVYAMNGQPSAHALAAPTIPALMPGEQPGDEFTASQAKTIDAEAHYVFNANGRTSLQPRPIAETPAENRLALRLLREAMKLNGPQSDTIPTAKALGWSDDSRDRAVKLIGGYIITKEGRKGGTFIGSRHKTLLALYSDVGAGRVTLNSQNAAVTQSA